MERKSASSTAVVTAAQVKASLGKRAQTLSADEDKALRMRHGVGADVQAPLPRAAGGNAELEDELLLVEMQLLRSMRARNKAPAALAAPASSEGAAAKAKIVRALRKKK